MPIYKIAEIIVEMNPKYEPLLSQSKAYLEVDNKEIDFSIPVIDNNIEAYHQEHPHLSIGECEYILMGSYFYTKLIEYNGILLHASAVCYKEEAYLFSAPSGTGKSTHTNLWIKNFKGSFILNDDKPAIRRIKNQLWVYGTPFSGKSDLNINERYPIKGICFIVRDEKNWINKLNSKDAITYLIRETVQSKRSELMNTTLNMVENILQNIPIYEMGCTISDESAKLSYRMMNLGDIK